ncbi:P-type conjugative transfer protein TrbL [Massilia sp. PWRC2]|uniref:P-type conjugative transfer protein TrbL n=1 Tax=Massilia sp. PWRC2 TaxID=2804626 RepID=UPI003CEFC500
MKMPVIFRSCRSMLLLFWLACFTLEASAAIDNAGILDNVLSRYSTASSAWAAIITTRASWLFWTLALISMVWTFGMMALRRGDIAEFYAEFVRFTIFTGFFWWLLVNGPGFAVSIINSLRQISAEATGLPNALAPSGIVDIGFDIFFKVLDQSSVWSPVDSGCGIIIGAIILVVFALVGVNMLLLLISSWILAYAGIFFLGFGGGRWTSDLAIGYFKTVLNIAAQLFTMVLLVGIGKSFVDQYYTAMSAGISLKELGVMLVVAAIMLALVKTIPGLIGGLAGGNVGALGSGFGAGAALAAAAVGAAAIGTAGAAVVAGAAGMAGGAQALMAAFSKASAAESAGGAASAAVMDAVGSAGSGGSGNASGGGSFADAMGDSVASAMSPSSTGSESSGFGSSAGFGGPKDTADFGTKGSGTAGSASSIGEGGAPGEVKSGRAMAAAGAMAAKVGRVGARTAINLVQGSWEVTKSKAMDVKDSAMERIGATTGGKIAAAINARKTAGLEGPGSPLFSKDGLSSGTKAADAQAEVAAFRDRDK